MADRITLRPECAADHEAIYDVTAAAFDGRPYADGDEADLVDALRARDALVVSLVAVSNEEVVGQVSLSPAFPADGSTGWYALGPVAVLPPLQGRGIGSRLVRAGLEALRARGATGCILTGNPHYYRRFGFEPCPSAAPPGEPAEYFMALVLAGSLPEGAIHFHPAFGDG